MFPLLPTARIFGRSASLQVRCLLVSCTMLMTFGPLATPAQSAEPPAASPAVSADDLYMRGRSLFQAGKVAESVVAFDEFVKLSPDSEKSLWERGIALYYAGEYARGAKQFELYQTYHDADVENAAWHFLCLARAEGLAKAREKLLPISGDTRVPMNAIHKLFAGKATPDEVLAETRAPGLSATASKGAAFYAHLYLGLYYEVSGKPDEAKKEIDAAVKSIDGAAINSYMGDVARVHAAKYKSK